MRRAPKEGHTYGTHVKTAEDYKAEADAKAEQARAEFNAKIENGTFTREDELEHIRTLESIQTEFADSLIALLESKNPG